MSEWDGVDPDNTRVLGASALLDGRGRGGGRGDEGGFEDTGSFEPQMPVERMANRDQESLAFFQVSAALGWDTIDCLHRTSVFVLIYYWQSVGLAFIDIRFYLYLLSPRRSFFGEPVAIMHTLRGVKYVR